MDERPRGRRQTASDGRLAFNLVGIVIVVITAPLSWLALDATRPAVTPAPIVQPSAAPAATGPIASGAASPASLTSATPRYGAGTWTRATPLDAGRWASGIALLGDGRVLVAGGTLTDTSNGAIASALLIDPATGGWSATVDMAKARTYPMAVTLADGSVLLAGGSAAGRPLDSAERYLPKEAKWTSAGRMSTPRTHAAAVVLKDGRVLVTGGGTGGASPFDSTRTAEVYDPESNGWTPVASMSHARSLHTATLLDDGRVLVAGGADRYHDGGTVTATAEIYDPSTNAWHDVAKMSVARYTQAAAILRDGRVLVAGGWSFTTDSDPSLASAEIYDPARDEWQPTGAMTAGRGQFRLATLHDGRVLAIGGVAPNYTVLQSVDLYAPVKGVWTATGPLPDNVMWPSVVTLADGRVLLAGGANTASASKQSALVAIFDPPAP